MQDNLNCKIQKYKVVFRIVYAIESHMKGKFTGEAGRLCYTWPWKQGKGALRLALFCVMVKASTTVPLSLATCSNLASVALTSVSREYLRTTTGARQPPPCPGRPMV